MMGGGFSSQASGSVVLSNALGGLLGGAAQSITDQAISSGTIDAQKVAQDSGEGFAWGLLSGKAKIRTERIAGKTIGKIQAKYSSPSCVSIIEKEVKKEFKAIGKALGKTGKQEMKREVSSRLNTFIEAESSLVIMGESLSENAIDATVDFAKTEIDYWLNEEF